MDIGAATPPADRLRTSLVVFSHPNHEVAIFGLLQRWRPTLLYLTDGGGPDRIAQTREGLRSIGLLNHAHFLDNTESSFYEALLHRDWAFFRRVAKDIARTIDACRPERVLCDAVEYYNPVHDLSLPLVLRALAMRRPAEGIAVEVLEIPLIHQMASAAEEYAVQQPIPSRTASQLTIQLTADELAAKRAARDHVYTLLAAQLGPVICGLPDERLAKETLIPAELPARRPEDCVLRYEWRAESLRRRGLIERSITYAGHFVPLVQALADDTPHGDSGTSGWVTP